MVNLLIKQTVHHHTGVWGLRSNNILKAMLIDAMLWSSSSRLCFSTKAFIICILACYVVRPYYIINHLPIYNRVLSKRINSPPRNSYILNRDQRIQYKGIQCQTHNPFISPFWVWTKPYPVDLQIRLNDHQFFPHLGCTVQSRYQKSSIRYGNFLVFNNCVHHRPSIVVWIIQNGLNPVFLNNLRNLKSCALKHNQRLIPIKNILWF